MNPYLFKGDDEDSSSEMVRMDDIDDDLEHDPMKRVERRGRKKKKNVVEVRFQVIKNK